MSSQFDKLSKYSSIVADTSELSLLKSLYAEDATTNPSLILKAANLPEYQHLIDDAVAFGQCLKLKPKERLEWTLDRLNVNFGVAISKLVPGRISTEVDARLAFKPQRTCKRARRLCYLYEQQGVPRDRVLIKVAATWQGIEAVRILEREGIHCNVTLVFNRTAQAVAAAEAGATLVSPFVGRVADWHKKNKGVASFAPAEDPGVLNVKDIYRYYKEHGYKTLVMGASFRSKEQVLELAGCDKLTISPQLIQELKATNGAKVSKKLGNGIEFGSKKQKRPNPTDDRHFYMRLCRDACATEKLAEGIRNFVKDTASLEKMLKSKIAAASGQRAKL